MRFSQFLYPVSVTLFVVAAACSAPEGSEPLAQSSADRLGNGSYNFGTLVSPGKCLDVAANGTADGTNVQEWTCNGTGAQSLRVDDIGGGLSRIVHTPSGKCIDVSGGGNADGTNIQLWTCNGTGAQAFRLDDWGNSNVVIVNPQSGKCVDVTSAGTADGTNVQLWTCNYSYAQIWHVASIAPIYGGGNNNNGGSSNGGGSSSGGGGGGGSSNGGSSGDWRLVWQDEFDGPNIDESKWSYEVEKPGWVNHELQAYTDHRKENARIENGHLVIEGRHDYVGGGEYSSARLKTQGHASWTYGRIEARIQVPGGYGTWPAFWMMPDDFSRGWPACGEIDIMEEVGYDQDSVHGTTHSQSYNWKSTQQRTSSTNVSGMTTDYHVYAVEWSTSGIDFYVDGRKYFTSPNDNTGDDAWPFHKNFYVILNLAIGGDWGGAQGVDPNIWPRQMLVDYVRVYQH